MGKFKESLNEMSGVQKAEKEIGELIDSGQLRKKSHVQDYAHSYEDRNREVFGLLGNNFISQLLKKHPLRKF